MNIDSFAAAGLYALIGVTADDDLNSHFGADPGVYAQVGTPATSGRQLASSADPGGYGMGGQASENIEAWTSLAVLGEYGYTGTPSSIPVIPSDAGKISYHMIGYPAKSRYIVHPITDAEFAAWLKSPDSYRTILIEVEALVNGVLSRRYLSNKGFVSRPTDDPPNIHYLPAMKGGIDYTSSLGLNGSSEVSFGDIQLDNVDGAFDDWLNDVWTNRSVTAWIGDARWPRDDFRMIFNGVLGGVDSKNRGTINLLLQDKLRRLEVPLTDQKVGGTGPNKDMAIPVTLGEVHNITPVLINEVRLEYKWHSGSSERNIEVRDNAIPVNANTVTGDSTFRLTKQPYGQITMSAQGDNTGGYRNDVAGLVQKLVMNYGTEPTQRFTLGDIDQDNFSAFAASNSAPVGLFASDRITVLQAADELATSVGARLVLDRLGRLRLVKLEVPPPGTPVVVTEADMMENTFRISQIIPPIPGCKLAFCKNWTVQDSNINGIPALHKELFAQEWLTTTASDPVIALQYGIDDEPAEEETHLLTRGAAEQEATRRLNLRRSRRAIYSFTGFADLLFLNLGDPMTIFHWRYGLEAGKTGQVVSLSLDWMQSQVQVGVLI